MPVVVVVACVLLFDFCQSHRQSIHARLFFFFLSLSLSGFFFVVGLFPKISLSLTIITSTMVFIFTVVVRSDCEFCIVDLWLHWSIFYSV